MTKNINEKKLENYKKRKILRILIIMLLLSTITLSILSLLKIVSIIWAIISFALSTFLSKYRETLVVDVKNKKNKGK